jgi:type II secretory pathway component GspD/PulD (secretin)
MMRTARLVAVLCAIAFAGCATAGPFRAGEKAERTGDWDRAVLEYSKALKEHPDNLSYQKALQRARLRATEAHAFSARTLAARGIYKEAVDEYRLALDLSPGTESLVAEMQEVEAKRLSAQPNPSIAEIKNRARETALPGLDLGPAAREPLGLSFREASLREVYEALGRVAGINFVFDPQFEDRRITLDLREVPFEQALAAVARVGQTFHRVADARVVNVVPDTPTKRREYEQQVVKTLFLSNADLKETIDLLRIVLGARRVAPLPGANALTIADAPDKVAAAERIVSVIDKQRAEVVVDVEILEVNRSSLKEYGIEITSGIIGTQGVVGGIFPSQTVRETTTDADGNTVTTTRPITLADNPYQSSNLLITNLPGVIYRLLKTDDATRLLANPQLRATEGQTAQARFGDQVPVPVTVFTPIAGGGLPQQPVTSFEYKNVGVNIDITPRVHHDGDVTLNLKVEVSSLGPLFQGNPTFRNRTVNSMIRLRDAETNILAGLISDEERTSVVGLPGLSAVPVLGRIFARNRKETAETDIVMTLTPHIVRRTPLSEEDLRSFAVGGDSSPLLFEVPAIPTVPPAVRPDAPPRIEPIRPPAPTPTPTPPPSR